MALVHSTKCLVSDWSMASAIQVIVPEEGWFGQPKYSTRSKKHSTLCRFLPLYSSFYL